MELVGNGKLGANGWYDWAVGGAMLLCQYDQKKTLESSGDGIG